MTTRSIHLDDSIHGALAALRRRIRSYVWIQGLAMVVATAGVVFWISLAVDWFFEPSLLLRKLLLGAAVFSIAVVAYRAIGRRAFVPLPDRSMAILLERRFPEFDASLLTAVELTARPPDLNDCNREMLAATCRAAAEPMAGVRLGIVFNWGPLRTAILAAAIVAGGTAAFGVSLPDSLAVWFRRAVLMSRELWPRRTLLTVEGFSDGVARVARGADFTLIVNADLEGRHVPRSVRIEYRPEGARRLDATMIREGQAVAGRDRFQAYSYTFRGILAPIDLDLRGGDASIRGLRIEVVDAPTLVRLEAECHYPDYMRRAPRNVPVAGVVPIPLGTQVTLRAEANKRLTEVELVSGETTQLVASPMTRSLHEIIALWRDAARAYRGGRVTTDGTEQLKAAAVQLLQLHDQAGRRLAGRLPDDSLRELLGTIEAARKDILLSADGQTNGPTALPMEDHLRDLLETVGRLMSFPRFVYHLQPIRETKTLELVLHDADGIKSHQPIRLVLSAVEDQPPQPVIQLLGIGSAITPQARLPFRGQVQDDYGVERVWLEYAVEGLEPRQQTFRQIEEIATQVPVDEAFEVDPLRLQPGSKILVTISARDRCALGAGPNVGSGDHWMLDVVTPEKLRAMLEAREIVLRQRFETIVEDVRGIRDTLAGLSLGDESTQPAPVGSPATEPGDSEQHDTAQRRSAVRLLRIQRSRQNGQKDSHETAGVAEAFEDIRQELVNNRVYTEELRIRIEDDIVAPLGRLVAQNFVQLDEELARLEDRHDDRRQSPGLRDGAVAQTDTILAIMQEVLSRMVELEDFNEAVQLLRSIIQEQEQLREAVRDRRKEKLRQLLED